MLIGYCVSPYDRKQMEIIKNLGYDYAELGLAPLWEMAKEQREELKEFLAKIGLPCPLANCALPGGYSLVDGLPDRLEQYANEAFAIAKEFGVSLLTIGSGSGRQFAEGQSRENALENYITAMKLLKEIADKNGITIAVEPLNKQECDLIYTMAEGKMVADASGVGITADLYHMYLEGDRATTFNQSTPDHVHVCCRNRTVPQPSDREYIQQCLTALKRTGYGGALSVEAQVPEDFEAGAKVALDMIKDILK